MKGWPVLAGALSWLRQVWGPSQSHVNRTSRKVLENNGPSESLRETSRTFRKELGYTSKIDVRRLGYKEDKISSKGNRSLCSVVDDAQSLRWLSVNIGWPDIPTQMANDNTYPAFCRRPPAKGSRQKWNSPQKIPQTSGFGASKPTKFSFGNLLFTLSEEFSERSTNSILTDVTQAGNREGSQVSPGYLGSRRWPWTVSQGWCQRAATREDLVPSGGSCCWWQIPGHVSSPSHNSGDSCWHGFPLAVAAHSSVSTIHSAHTIFLSLLLTGRYGQLSTSSEAAHSRVPPEHFIKSESTPVSKWTYWTASIGVMRYKPK